MISHANIIPASLPCIIQGLVWPFVDTVIPAPAFIEYPEYHSWRGTKLDPSNCIIAIFPPLSATINSSFAFPNKFLLASPYPLSIEVSSTVFSISPSMKTVNLLCCATTSSSISFPSKSAAIRL